MYTEPKGYLLSSWGIFIYLILGKNIFMPPKLSTLYFFFLL